MIDLIVSPKYRREIKGLQLTAMIDVFSIIVLFLVLSAIFGVSDLKLPKGLILPLSISRESSVSAPSLVIHQTNVEFGPFSETLPLTLFQSGEPSSLESRDKFQLRLVTYLKSVPEENKASGVLLNVIADRDATYATIYDVLYLFRKAGFDTLMFVATSEGQPK